MEYIFCSSDGFEMSLKDFQRREGISTHANVQSNRLTQYRQCVQQLEKNISFFIGLSEEARPHHEPHLELDYFRKLDPNQRVNNLVNFELGIRRIRFFSTFPFCSHSGLACAKNSLEFLRSE